MKHTKVALWTVLFFCTNLFYACTSDEDSSDLPPYNLRQIVEFSLLPTYNPENIWIDHYARIYNNAGDVGTSPGIDEVNKVIYVQLPQGADPTTLRPYMVVSPFAKTIPESLEVMDLSKPNQEIQVIAQSGKSAWYNVVVLSTPYKYTGANAIAVTLTNVTVPSTGLQCRGVFNTSGVAEVWVPEGTDPTQIRILFEWANDSRLATVDRADELDDFIDFTEPQTFVVTSNNGANTKTYTIHIVND